MTEECENRENVLLHKKEDMREGNISLKLAYHSQSNTGICSKLKTLDIPM